MTDEANKLAAKAVEPIIEFLRRNKGARAELARMWEEATGLDGHTFVNKWLADKPEHRTQPLLGNWLLMRSLADKLMARKVAAKMGKVA